MEAWEEGDGDEDDDGFLAMADFNLWEDGVSEMPEHSQSQYRALRGFDFSVSTQSCRSPTILNA